MMIDLRSDSNISPIPPVIFARVKIAKSGLNCKFGFWSAIISKRSKTSKIWNPHCERKWLAYSSSSSSSSGTLFAYIHPRFDLGRFPTLKNRGYEILHS